MRQSVNDRHNSSLLVYQWEGRVAILSVRSPRPHNWLPAADCDCVCCCNLWELGREEERNLQSVHLFTLSICSALLLRCCTDKQTYHCTSFLQLCLPPFIESPKMSASSGRAMLEPLSVWERLLEWFLFHFRWVCHSAIQCNASPVYFIQVFVVPFLLPLSFAYEKFIFIRNWIVFQLQSAPKAHDRKVALIQKQVREWNQGDKSRKMCTARAGYLTMSFRFPSYKANSTLINTDKLVDILEVSRNIGFDRDRDRWVADWQGEYDNSSGADGEHGTDHSIPRSTWLHSADCAWIGRSHCRRWVTVTMIMRYLCGLITIHLLLQEWSTAVEWRPLARSTACSSTSASATNSSWLMAVSLLLLRYFIEFLAELQNNYSAARLSIFVVAVENSGKIASLISRECSGEQGRCRLARPLLRRSLEPWHIGLPRGCHSQNHSLQTIRQTHLHADQYSRGEAWAD